MNFYSDDIINDIVDNSPLEELDDKIKSFREEILGMFVKYSYKSIAPSYIYNLLLDESNKSVFYCMDTKFDIYNCPSSMIYNRKYDSNKNEITYYILLICTKPKFKGQGYASILLNGFIEYLKNKKSSQSATTKIVLSSTVYSVTFYESYGFKWTRESLKDHPKLMQYEKFEEDKEYFIMELLL